MEPFGQLYAVTHVYNCADGCSEAVDAGRTMDVAGAKSD